DAIASRHLRILATLVVIKRVGLVGKFGHELIPGWCQQSRQPYAGPYSDQFRAYRKRCRTGAMAGLVQVQPVSLRCRLYKRRIRQPLRCTFASSRGPDSTRCTWNAVEPAIWDH